jgi:hypothetical protein
MTDQSEYTFRRNKELDTYTANEADRRSLMIRIDDRNKGNTEKTLVDRWFPDTGKDIPREKKRLHYIGTCRLLFIMKNKYENRLNNSVFNPEGLRNEIDYYGAPIEREYRETGVVGYKKRMKAYNLPNSLYHNADINIEDGFKAFLRSMKLDPNNYKYTIRIHDKTNWKEVPLVDDDGSRVTHFTSEYFERHVPDICERLGLWDNYAVFGIIEPKEGSEPTQDGGHYYSLYSANKLNYLKLK